MCASECVLKTLACRGLRVGPSKDQKTADVWKKDVWDFQAFSQTLIELRFAMGNEGKHGKKLNSQTWPGTPRRPSPRHPRPPEKNSRFSRWAGVLQWAPHQQLELKDLGGQGCAGNAYLPWGCSLEGGQHASYGACTFIQGACRSSALRCLRFDLASQTKTRPICKLVREKGCLYSGFRVFFLERRRLIHKTSQLRENHWFLWITLVLQRKHFQFRKGPLVRKRLPIGLFFVAWFAWTDL